MRRAALALLVALLPGGAVQAHDMQMAIVEVRAVAERSYALTLRTALGAERLPGIELSFPEGCADVAPIRRAERFDHVAFERRIACPAGAPPPVLGVWNAGIVDVLVRIEDQAGDLTTRIVSEPFAEIALGEPGAGFAERFLLGVEHILSGADHLMFVFGILLLVHGVRTVVATITAFTLAHSLTLALTVLDVVRVPGPPVEAFIALSIVYLALEVARRGRARGARLTPPWAVAFAFGLIHGFGFAGALAETGLPPGEVPMTLFLFNLGIEAGQVVFAGGAAAVLWLAYRLLEHRAHTLDRAAAYGLGSVASFWVIDRVAGFW